MIPGPIADHASLPGELPSGEADSPVAVRYLSRREPRPDRSPRSQRSFAPSATYGSSASSRARLTARYATGDKQMSGQTDRPARNKKSQRADIPKT
jgi:hypothetical protein